MTIREDVTFQTLVLHLEEDQIATLREIRALALITQQHVREICGVAIVHARTLARDAASRDAFYAEAFPTGWKRFHHGKLLLHVLMYFYGATKSDGTAYRTASAHSVALQAIYRDRRIADNDVVRHIEARGIYPDSRDDDDIEESEEQISDDVRPSATGVTPRRMTGLSSALSERNFDVDDANDEAEEADVAPLQSPAFRRPKRKPPKLVVVLKRLPWKKVVQCVLGRPRSQADREAIMTALNDGKAVWVKLIQGAYWDYEFQKGGGQYLDVPIAEYRVED